MLSVGFVYSAVQKMCFSLALGISFKNGFVAWLLAGAHENTFKIEVGVYFMQNSFLDEFHFFLSATCLWTDCENLRCTVYIRVLYLSTQGLFPWLQMLPHKFTSSAHVTSHTCSTLNIKMIFSQFTEKFLMYFKAIFALEKMPFFQEVDSYLSGFFTY